MSENYQKTVYEAVKLEGVGLHSGTQSKINILPGKEDQGIIFKRVDLKENNFVEAKYENVTSARLCTTLENKFGVKVSTVEHLMAALYILEIDNAFIEIDNEEVPIMDGSAIDFLNAIKKVKLKILPKKRKCIKITKKFELIDGERKISIEPSENSFEVDFQLDYQNKIIGKQRNLINFQRDDLNDVSKSRTFCLFEDIEKIKKAGLAKGGSLENAVVVDADKVLNNGGLRNKKEFVNHKILDLAGDFLLSGYRILGKVKCYQGGHELTNMFLRKLLNANDTFDLFESKNIHVEKNIELKPFIKVAVNA
jgi:UDP-3-O-[3-hydroxymyristoyl] N-acetylglucosamine deacetylase